MSADYPRDFTLFFGSLVFWIWRLPRYWEEENIIGSQKTEYDGIGWNPGRKRSQSSPTLKRIKWRNYFQRYRWDYELRMLRPLGLAAAGYLYHLVQKQQQQRERLHYQEVKEVRTTIMRWIHAGTWTSTPSHLSLLPLPYVSPGSLLTKLNWK